MPVCSHQIRVCATIGAGRRGEDDRTDDRALESPPTRQKSLCYTSVMMTSPFSSAHLSDGDLLAEVKRLAARERQATAQLIASLIELDTRRLYLGEGCSSLFTYCTQVLRLSEHAAYGRIEAARAARRFPAILDRLADGSITLTAVGLLAPHLTSDNHHELLDAVRHKSKRDVERLVACLRPQPAVPSAIRKLPAPKPPEVLRATVDEARPETSGLPAGNLPRPARPAVVAPLAPECYKVQFTVGRATYDKLRRAQDLLRHSIPNGDPAAIFDRALTVLLAELTRTKLAASDRPCASRATTRRSRHLPAAVKRAVWARDGGRCAFVGANGRCTETGFLEFHHLVPYAVGGEAVAENLELRCAAHNAFEAERYFGPRQPLLVREDAEYQYWETATRSGPSWRFEVPG
jgi:hypothetical protein